MATTMDAGLLIQKLATSMASKELALEATLLTVVLILAQVQWIRHVSLAVNILLRRALDTD